MRPLAQRTLAIGLSLFLGLLPVWEAVAGRAPVDVVAFDSGTRVVREIAEALTGTGRSILESYPRGSKIFLGLISLLPERARITAIEWGMRHSLGHAAGRADEVSIATLAEWCVSQYPGTERYPAIVLGSPNGAVAHIASLLGAPFLTTSFGLAFRHPLEGSNLDMSLPIDPDDLAGYQRTCRVVAERIVAGNAGSGYEIICHYDPIHDRSIVQTVAFIRIKLRDLPACYRVFIRDRLASNGALLLIDCGYSWPQFALGDRTFLQIGGLGAIAPTEYLERWSIDAPREIRRESEWGCPESFAVAVGLYAETNDIRLVTISRDHPAEYSLLAYDAYRACDEVRSDAILIDCFNHQNPNTNITAGIPGLWLPFNTADGVALVERALQDKTFDTIYFAPLPSFARSPDTVSLDVWAELLVSHGALEWMGVRPDMYPADPLAPYRLVHDMASLRAASERAMPLRLSIEEFEALLPAAR